MIRKISTAVCTIALLSTSGSFAASLPFPYCPNDTVEAKTDSVAAKKKNEKDEKKTEKEDKNAAYTKLLKDGGSYQQGMLAVRHIKDNWYFEVPDSLLGRLLLAVTRFNSVPQGFKMLSGEEVNRSAVYFERYGEKVIFLREYVQSQFADPKDNIAIALNQSTVNPIIQKFDVIGRNPKTGAHLIEVTKFFTADNKVSGFTSNDRTILSISGIASDRTFVDTVKAYPINVEIQTLRTYNASSGKSPASRTGAITLNLTTSIVMLPKTPMQARYADKRVGYFTNHITKFSDIQQTPEHEQIISRYRLIPKDPARYRRGELTEPQKQIVYYIDPATPKQWVPYLIAGVNDWNKAFEQAGFKNAIVAKEWPNDPDMSLDDARYSVIRYLPSETENAYGPRIVDPRSGEIIESHICWYHNVMNLVKKWYMVQCGPLDPKARSMNFDEKLMGQLIRFVSSHEVGHSLGLRHNMVASSSTPVEKLRDKQWVEKHGHTVSIMDYARFNYVAQPEDGISRKGLFPRINDYDKWAIQWGYQYRPEFKSAAKEKDKLRIEVTKALTANPRLRYLGDEGKGQDPRSQTEDLGDNSMKAGDYGIKNLKRVMDNIETWTAQPDGQYDDLNTIYKSVRAQYIKYTNHVQRNIGGKYTNNWPGVAPFDIVPKARQKEAIDWMDRQLFTAPLWLYPESIVNKVGLDANDEIRNRQTTVLALMLAPTMVYNIYTNSLSSARAYPVDEYLDDVFNSVWKPLNNANEQQNNFRRQLERSYLNFVNTILNPTPSKENSIDQTAANRSDVMLFMTDQLDKIENYIKAQQPQTAQGSINARHYNDLLHNLRKIRKQYEGDDGK